MRGVRLEGEGGGFKVGSWLRVGRGTGGGG